MNNEERNYALLRPATIEYIKAGGKVCLWNSDKELEYFVTKEDRFIAMLDSDSSVLWFADEIPNVFRQVPLCWIENKPVYKGDVLYGVGGCSDLMYIVKELRDGAIYTEENETDAYCEGIENLTWTKPVTKKKYWVNIYDDAFGDKTTVVGVKYSCKEYADKYAKNHRIACVEIELEE